MTEKEIKSLFDKLNPNESQKQKAWNNISNKKSNNNRSAKKILLIAAIISTIAVFSTFTINAFSGGMLFENISAILLGKNNIHISSKISDRKTKLSVAHTTSPVSTQIGKKKDSKAFQNKNTSERILLNSVKKRYPPAAIESVANKTSNYKTIQNKNIESPDKKTKDKIISSSENKISETQNEEELIKNDYIYLPISASTAKIVGYSGNEEKVNIPDKIDNYKITCIDGWAFTCQNNITDISIPEGVNSINEKAFYGCKNLSSVKLPNTLLSIGRGAFRTTAIKRIDIPDNVTKIEKGAFANCEKLSNVKIGKGIQTIERSAFNPSDIITISGYSDTAAYEYAVKNGIRFINLGYFKKYISINTAKWSGFSEVYCHIWNLNGNSFFVWQSDSEKCVDAGNGIYIYDISLLEKSTAGKLKDGENYLVVFSTNNGMQTYDCTFGSSCIGDTLLITGKIIENPLDCDKNTYEALWDLNNQNYGPHLSKTSIGNIVGSMLCPNESKE